MEFERMTNKSNKKSNSEINLKVIIKGFKEDYNFFIEDFDNRSNFF